MNQGEKMTTLESEKPPTTPEVLEVVELTPEEALADFGSAVTDIKDRVSQNNQKAESIVTAYSGAEHSDIEAVQGINATVIEGEEKAEKQASEEISEIKGEQNISIEETKKDVEVMANVEANKDISIEITGERNEVDYDRKIELLLGDPNTDTAKIFCLVDTTGLSKKERSTIYDNPENWDGRRSLHERLKRENIQQALDLSKRLERENPRIPPPTIFALRGSPGAGKTTSLRKGNEMFKGILDEHGQPSGSLAPDVFKGPLKEKGNLSSVQVHAESTMLGRSVKKEVSNADTSVVFDKLMNEHADIEEMIESAKETGRKIAIMDIDVPLELSAVRVLGREKGGADPNVPFGAVGQAFQGIRGNREVEHKALDDNPQLVNGYVLMAYDKESRQSVEVAVWDEEAGKVRIIEGRENLAGQSIEEPEEEIERIKNTVITEEYIKNFTTTYFDEKSQQHAEKTAETLRQYLGKTISMALDEKAQ